MSAENSREQYRSIRGALLRLARACCDEHRPVMQRELQQLRAVYYGPPEFRDAFFEGFALFQDRLMQKKC